MPEEHHRSACAAADQWCTSARPAASAGAEEQYLRGHDDRHRRHFHQHRCRGFPSHPWTLRKEKSTRKLKRRKIPVPPLPSPQQQRCRSDSVAAPPPSRALGPAGGRQNWWCTKRASGLTREPGSRVKKIENLMQFNTSVSRQGSRLMGPLTILLPFHLPGL